MGNTIMQRWSRDARSEMKDEVKDALCDVDPQYWPSVHQFANWRDLVEWSDGCDPDGYFLGRCPFQYLADRGVDHMARWNFDRGVVRCDGHDDFPSCHGPVGRTVSLSTVAAMMSARLIDVINR